MQILKNYQEQSNNQLSLINHSLLTSHDIRLNGRKLHITSPLDLCLTFAQSMELVLLSYIKLNDGSAIMATLSSMLLCQIESEEDILNVVFALNKSHFRNITDNGQLQLYLFDDVDNNSEMDDFCCSFSISDWLKQVKTNQIS
ncbi:TPA: hypothetical protein NJ084_000530 [Vibrio parahaemolyticus]|jgi:hypothetical protein|uniref:hypothetical protein n=1 Tax=Vibrio harveyi group TaxID=717610 RepID=UPI0003C7D509|nr:MULTISPECIES: hypothetical protein [Vibrio harveyi group]MBM5118573.1 hypothetical protein [Vibrio parahaemolyticus]MBM5123771.1 hypothetical protein [Vibrio parahaemolyticus]MBM5129378.1 hypothetical protein [Vibrio parahaemolyticus]MBM5142595.1 hypothetical protein [Vibrio parahaemolyticus]MDF4773014.1 hypothetical protein [Vibrio parahaemolyticus]